MLEGLDTIDWAALTHAHGPAGDVPELLRALLSDDDDERQQACWDLHETIWHQGTVFSASAAAIPFLYELLNHSDAFVRGGGVSLIGAIATGEYWVHYGLRVDGEQVLRKWLAKEDRSLEDALAEERAAMEAIHRNVSVGLRQLLPYLSDREGLGAGVAETLGNFPEHSSWLVPAIDAVLTSESDDHIRRLLAKSKARLTHLWPKKSRGGQ